MAKTLHCAALLAVFAVCRAEEEDVAPEEVTIGPTYAPSSRTLAPLAPGATYAPTGSPTLRPIDNAQAKAAVDAMVAASFKVVGKNGVQLTVESGESVRTAEGNLQVTFKFSGDLDNFNKAAEDAAKAELARRLGIDVSRVEIRDKRAGSVIIVFFINNGFPVAVAIVPRTGGDDGLSDGAIAGIVIGSVVGAGIIAFVLVYCFCCDQPAEGEEEAKTDGASNAETGSQADGKADGSAAPTGQADTQQAGGTAAPVVPYGNEPENTEMQPPDAVGSSATYPAAEDPEV